MISSKKELFKWGPIDGRPIYVDYFIQAFLYYQKYTGISWPDVIHYFKNDKLIVIADYERLRDRGEKLFKKYVLDDRQLKRAYENWFEIAKEIKNFRGKIDKKRNEDELKDLFKNWNKIYLDFWLTGFLPEISNWGGERLLKNKIIKFNKANFIEIFEGLSAPEDLSFFQKEELELMQIKLKGKIKQEEALEKHQGEYYWLRNSYGFTEILDANYFKKELNKISVREAKEKIVEIKNYPKKVRLRKKELIKKYKINQEIVNIAEKLSHCIWWQDLRKKYIFMANDIISEFNKQISRISNISFKELCYYTSLEVVNFLENNKKIDAKKRFKGFIIYYHEKNDLTFRIGKQANNFAKVYLEVKVDKSLKEFKGLVVSKGKIIRGRAKILLTPRNLDKMNKGDILVAPMTSPDFIVAMRKASAVITDEGGMTCHAAIVSRELGIPCIVGTRIASKVLKDKDVVEVDTNRGIIEIIKN